LPDWLLILWEAAPAPIDRGRSPLPQNLPRNPIDEVEAEVGDFANQQLKTENIL